MVVNERAKLMKKHASLSLATLAFLAMGSAFAGSALANCGMDHQSVSLPTTTATTSPAPTPPQAPQTPDTNG